MFAAWLCRRSVFDVRHSVFGVFRRNVLCEQCTAAVV